MDKLFGTVISERVIDFITLLILIAFVLVMKFDQVGGFFKDNIIDPLHEKYFSSSFFLDYRRFSIGQLRFGNLYFQKENCKK